MKNIGNIDEKLFVNRLVKPHFGPESEDSFDGSVGPCHESCRVSRNKMRHNESYYSDAQEDWYHKQ
jgi:hypothetical protein